MNRQVVSIFIIFVIFSTYNCAHLKSQVNLALSQQKSYDSENFNFFQQSKIKKDYETEDFKFLQQEQEENYEFENFNFLQQEEEEENYEVENFDFNANLLQTQNQWQVKNAKIAIDGNNVPNVFLEEEIYQYRNYNTQVLSNQMKIFSAKYHYRMVPLIRLKKYDNSAYKFITVPFQQQEYDFYWYKYHNYTFDKVIGYVYGRESFPQLQNNPDFVCLISVFNRQQQSGGVFPKMYIFQFLSQNKGFTQLNSGMCLPK